METFNIERLSERDIPELIALSNSLGWDYSTPELRTILASGVAFGHRSAAGELVSSAAIFPYGETLASIGMVMVHPDYRRRGLGQAVTGQVIKSVPDGMPIMLVATAAGKMLYEVMGFQTVGTLHKMIGERYEVAGDLSVPNGYEILPLREEHLPEVIRLDQDAVGGDRTHFLKWRVGQAVEGLVIEQAGKVVGYGLSVEGPVFRIIGPIVAPSTELAAVLVDHLARNHDGAVRIDVPSQHESLVARLASCGFGHVATPPVMMLRGDRLPRSNQSLYSVAAQAFG